MTGLESCISGRAVFGGRSGCHALPERPLTADPGFFLHFLDEANKQPGVAAWKSLMLDGLRLQPGMQVLDAGCGIGTDAFELAALVNPGSAVTGVDFS